MWKRKWIVKRQRPQTGERGRDIRYYGGFNF